MGGAFPFQPATARFGMKAPCAGNVASDVNSVLLLVKIIPRLKAWVRNRTIPNG